jgi:hypothetical protein
MQNMFTELKKLANSENFANSEISLETFADSEPRAKFLVFSEADSLSLGSVVAIGDYLCSHLCIKNTLYYPISNAHHILRI